MVIIDNLKMYWRFAWGLRSYVRRTLTLDEARDIIKRRMDQREDSFLRIVRRTVFEYPKSPYLPLMKLAGCEYGDIENLVRSQGLESTLRALREAGVYISFEELKGRIPIERGGASFKVNICDFENPYLGAHFKAETGGTTGVGRRIPIDLDYMGDQSPQLMLVRQAHGVLDAPTAFWRGPIPDGTGLLHMLRAIRYNRIPHRWFIADLRGDAKPRLSYRLITSCFVNYLRFWSVPVPRPEPLGLDRAIVVARWIHEVLKSHGICCIQTPAGRALRICLAAQDAGISLAGTVFMVGGEPISPGKAQAIKDSGASYFPTYSMYEMGQIAMGCAKPIRSDDMHLFKDCFALITQPIHLDGTAEMVSALHFTSLLPTAPIIMLNTQIDDHALVEERSCGCELEKLGYTQHVSKVSSCSKLVTEGVSFIGSDIVQILEQSLPAKFGGSLLDYQLLEEEDPSGLTRVNLIVSPRVEINDEDELKAFFFNSLKKGPDSYNWAQNLWEQGHTLKIRRMEPYATARGKHLSLWRKRITNTDREVD